MSKNWKIDTVGKLHSGAPYGDRAVFEVISGDFENFDSTIEKRLGVRWNTDGTIYPRGDGFALPRRVEELKALRQAIDNFLTNSED